MRIFRDRLLVIASRQTVTGEAFQKEGFRIDLTEQAKQTRYRGIKGFPEKDENSAVQVRIDYWKFMPFAETCAEEEYALDALAIPPPHMMESTS